MPIELRVPSLGESITQATIGAWLKREGEAVQADEPVVEVESEKATVAVPAPASGVLARVLKPSGATVAVGEVIGVLDEKAAARGAAAAGAEESTPPTLQRTGATPPSTASSPPPATATSTATSSPAPAEPSQARDPAPERDERARGSTPTSTSTPTSPETPTSTRPNGDEGSRGPLRAPPSVRRRMAEHGLDAASLGGGEVIRREQVERAIEARSGAPAAPAAPPPAIAPGAGRDGAGDRERLVPLTPLRRTVARRLLEAQQQAAILTTFNEIDMAKVIALREKHGEAFQEKHGVKLGFMSFFVKASVEALRAFPVVNGEIRGNDVVYKDHYDVGVAVGGGKGLVVPVIRDADRLTFAEIEKEMGALAKKARENRITMQDLEGGTFTISNGGIYGSLLSTPILNPPQSGILGLHKIEKRPIAGPGDSVVVRPMMYVALSYDHRLVDGREAVSFLVRVKECVEDPERLMLEI
jgi:2-oxoglutarate dehydrogenase E2 component (dihydrolipoamide succinyltransferase)